MATTTNYGWTTPDDTSLVKDGAAAIRTLGSSIDTSLVDLRGGTTGQVLRKQSNTQMDFEWAAPSSGLTLINTTSFSAVSSQSINDVFSATYNAYRIILDLSYSATGISLGLRLRVSGSDTSSAIYRKQTFNAFGTTVNAARDLNETSWPNVAFAHTTTANGGTSNNLEIYSPFEAKTTTAITSRAFSPDANIEAQFWFFGINSNTSFTGFTLIPDSGTISGSVSVLGYNQ